MTSASASRVTRNSRSLRLALLLFAGSLAAVTVLRAQEPPAAVEEKATTGDPERAEATKAEPSPAKDGTEAPPADAPASAAAPDRKPGVVGPTPGRFEPTEKVRADFDVSFPVDI